MNQNNLSFLIFVIFFMFIGFMIGIAFDFFDENQFVCNPLNVVKEIEPNRFQIIIVCNESG